MRFLETSGLFGSLTLRTLDAATATKIANANHDIGTTFTGTVVDAQIVIAHMTDVLDQLIDANAG